MKWFFVTSVTVTQIFLSSEPPTVIFGKGVDPIAIVSDGKDLLNRRNLDENLPDDEDREGREDRASS